jgi:hypothetical protein
MSVYKSKRGESAAQFVETARLLEVHTLAQCLKVPKRYTFLLTTEVMRLASEVYNNVKSANSIFPANKHDAQMRRDKLTEANNALQCLIGKLGLLGDTLKKNPEQFKGLDNALETWGNLIMEEAKLISGVKKSDKQRFKDLPDL